MTEEKKDFVSSFQMKLGKFAAELKTNIYVTAIRDAMLAYVPFTFIASIFLILAAFPVEGFNTFVSSVLHVPKEVWQAKLLIVNNASLAIGGLMVTLTSSHAIAEKMKLNQMQVMLAALVSYLVLTPTIELKDGGTAVGLSSIGSQSLFLAIVVGLLTAVMYRAIDKRGFKIKMPASVPPAVSEPFESLIPWWFHCWFSTCNCFSAVALVLWFAWFIHCIRCHVTSLADAGGSK